MSIFKKKKVKDFKIKLEVEIDENMLIGAIAIFLAEIKAETNKDNFDIEEFNEWIKNYYENIAFLNISVTSLNIGYIKKSRQNFLKREAKKIYNAKQDELITSIKNE